MLQPHRVDAYLGQQLPVFIEVLPGPGLDVVGEVVETLAKAAGAEEDTFSHQSAHDPIGHREVLRSGFPFYVTTQDLFLGLGEAMQPLPHTLTLPSLSPLACGRSVARDERGA